MPIDGTLTDGNSDTELQNMALREEADQSGPHAPLLAPTDASPDYDHEADDGVPASELQYSGGWFIWSLTFSAGISGLLFGYEYANSFHSILWYQILTEDCLIP
jgi:hypothetical protein